MSTPAAAAPELREIPGPGAFDGDWRRTWNLLWYMAASEMRRSYVDDRLGYLWTLLRPLLLFGVLILILRQVLRFGAGIENFAQFLLLNIMLFSFFTEATSNALAAVKAREKLARKMQFPRIVIPLSVVLTATLTTAINVVVTYGLLLVTGLEPRWTWLLLPLIVLVMMAFVVGVSMLLSALYVRFTDVRQVWRLMSRSLFYLTPVIYPIELVPDSFRPVVAANPLAPLFEQARVWVVDPSAPSISEAAGGSAALLIPIAIGIGVFAAGLWLFSREASRLAEMP